MVKKIIASRYFGLYSIFFLITLCVISRLPQLYSQYLLLDEDECVLGLMAKHMHEGKEVSVFFWGQVYGFSLLETALISTFYFLFGYSDVSVKLAMLLLFSTGIIFFYKTLQQITTNKWLPFVITLLFILSPAWAVWSMKARGGYLTSFFLSAIFTWLLFKPYEKIILKWFLLGMLTALIFYSQPLWLPGLLPLLFYQVKEDKPYTKLFNLLVGGFPVVIIIESIKRSTYHIWHPNVFDKQPDFKNTVSLLYDHLKGYYYLDNIYPAPFVCKLFAGLFIALVFMLMAFAIYRSFQSYKQQQLFILSVLAIFLTLCYSLFLSGHSPRYLLPLSGSVLIALCLFLQASRRRWKTLPALFILMGVACVISFKNYNYSPFTKAQLLACRDYLLADDTRFVFCNDVPQEWQLMFYSQEQIICRESNNIDRYPRYIQEVDSVYQNASHHTAVVDFSGDLKDMEPDSTMQIAGKFYMLSNPSKNLLKDMEVRF